MFEALKKSQKNKRGNSRGSLIVPITRQPRQQLGEKFTLPCVLSIAGSDSSGGAGIQADIKTIQALGLFSETAITAITAQNTTGVRAVQNVSPEIIEAQIDAVFEDIPPQAVKIGMVSVPEIVQAIARALIRNNAKNIVVDPVMVATSGSALAKDDAVQAMREHLFPLASVITPNLTEAEVLAGFPIKSAEDAVRAAHVIQDECKNSCADIKEKTQKSVNENIGKNNNTCAVLIKGGHGLQGPERATSHSKESACKNSLSGVSNARVRNPATSRPTCDNVLATKNTQLEAPANINHACDDLLFTADGTEAWLYGMRINNPNTHGTGCTLSSAIASYLALGYDIPQAVGAAKDYLTGAIGAQLNMGTASGPLDHFWQFRELNRRSVRSWSSSICKQAGQACNAN